MAPQASYEIDWSSVPATQEPQPLFTATKLTHGVCSCDLTRNHCDAFCCCDPDCSASQLSLFKTSSTGGCTPVRNATNKPMTCIYTTRSADGSTTTSDRGGLFALAYFNPASGMNYFVPSATRRELCIERDNNPSDGLFYTDRGQSGLGSGSG